MKKATFKAKNKRKNTKWHEYTKNNFQWPCSPSYWVERLISDIAEPTVFESKIFIKFQETFHRCIQQKLSILST